MSSFFSFCDCLAGYPATIQLAQLSYCHRWPADTLLFYWCLLFWIGQLPQFIDSLVISELRFNTKVIERSTRMLVLGIPVIAVMTWTALFIQANLFRMVVQVRNYLIVFVSFFIVGILALLIQFKGELFHFVWFTIPAGLAFAFFFAELKRRWIAEIVHLFLILAILFFSSTTFITPQIKQHEVWRSSFSGFQLRS